ncbi:MAG TPA: hypothetical protein VH852_02125 [Hyphomicrobium sp.]|jgi:hypothetical protein
MAKILTFRPGRRDGSALASQSAKAEVIVFPGVRYERWDDAREAEARPAPASGKRSLDRRRDVLELAE